MAKAAGLLAIRLGALGLCAVLLACCGEDEPESVAEEPRPIKTFTVANVAGGMLRKYTGVVQASSTTALSFPVAGTVQDVAVAVGERVVQGDILAKLDPEPFSLDVQAAEAELQRTLADLAADRDELARQTTLFEKGWVAAAAIEKHQAAFESSRSLVDYARSRLAVARRNLADATLTAPFAGVIAERDVDSFQDVGVGQKLFALDSVDTLQVSFAVSEAGIGRIGLGQPIQITFPTSDDRVEGRITEIASAATEGRAYPVKASLLDPPATLRQGMTAEISIEPTTAEGVSGFFVPLSSIAPGTEAYRGFVFKYDSAAGAVRKIPIAAKGVRDNLVIVTEGIAAGDVIAAAGVSFLIDGQRVRPLEE